MMQRRIYPWVFSSTLLLIANCSSSPTAATGSDLASISINQLPQGVDKSTSTLSVSKVSAAQPTIYNLDKLSSVTLDPGQYNFELVLHNGTEEIGRTKEGSIVCPPLKNETIKNGTNSLEITVCEPGTNKPVPPATPNGGGGVDIAVDVAKDIDLTSYTNISIEDLLNELRPAVTELQLGKDALFNQIKTKYRKDTKWHFTMRPQSTGSTYLDQHNYFPNNQGGNSSVGVFVSYDGSELGPLELPTPQQPTDVYGTVNFISADTRKITIHFNGIIKR